jgi:hypothetical protein
VQTQSQEIQESSAKRERTEAQTGKRVVTGENYLPPGSAKKIRSANEE